MITMAQRIEELRTEKGLSRPALSAALGFPKTAAEKFETGRATPTAEQQKKMADFFGVSLFYLKGESNDKTRQETWMDGDFVDDDEPVQAPSPSAPVRPGAPAQERRRGPGHRVRLPAAHPRLPGHGAGDGAGGAPLPRGAGAAVPHRAPGAGPAITKHDLTGKRNDKPQKHSPRRLKSKLRGLFFLYRR